MDPDKNYMAWLRIDMIIGTIWLFLSTGDPF